MVGAVLSLFSGKSAWLGGLRMFLIGSAAAAATYFIGSLFKAEADELLVKPLLQFRNFGVPLPHNWTTVINSAEFGTDYCTRTAVAKSNTFINRPRETRYFYQDLDKRGSRLTGANRYTVTFPHLPPVDPHGLRSITLYNQHHFFAPNEIDRFSLGTKSQGLHFEPDGSLVIHVQKDKPDADKRTRCRTGCRRLTMSSRSISAPIGRSKPSTKAAGRRRRWSSRNSCDEAPARGEGQHCCKFFALRRRRLKHGAPTRPDA